jgi:hypothetical protein
MNADEIMALERPLTDEETAFLEQEVLKLAKALQAEVARITADIEPGHEDLVERLRNAAGRTVENIDAAIALGPVNGSA